MHFDLVSVAEYAEFLEHNPRHEPPHWEVQKEHPHNAVTFVSATDADAYAVWSGRRLGTDKELAQNTECRSSAICSWTSSFEDSGRVLRGGGWLSVDVGNLRVSFRFGYRPGDRNDYLGFRCARPESAESPEKV